MSLYRVVELDSIWRPQIAIRFKLKHLFTLEIHTFKDCVSEKNLWILYQYHRALPFHSYKVWKSRFVKPAYLRFLLRYALKCTVTVAVADETQTQLPCEELK